MSTPTMAKKGFFATLFDFGFTSFLTLKFLKVIYAIIVVVTCLAGLIFLIVGLASGSAAGVLLGLIGAPLVTLIYLIIARIYLEVVAMFFRIGENTSILVQILGGGNAASGGQTPAQFYPPVPYGQPQAPGYYGQSSGPGYGQSPDNPYGQTNWGPSQPPEQG